MCVIIKISKSANQQISTLKLCEAQFLGRAPASRGRAIRSITRPPPLRAYALACVVAGGSASIPLAEGRAVPLAKLYPTVQRRKKI
jgi:hypothetical protein